MQVLNREFDPVAKTTSRTWLVAPTLLDKGQAQLLAQPAQRYRISMLRVGQPAWTMDAGALRLSCTPDLSSIAPDLIFLVSCDKRTEEYEFRVLRPDGKLALKNLPTSSTFGYAAQGSADRQEFVVKTVESTRPVPDGALFSAADFSSEELSVYRAARRPADAARAGGVLRRPAATALHWRRMAPSWQC